MEEYNLFDEIEKSNSIRQMGGDILYKFGDKSSIEIDDGKPDPKYDSVTDAITGIGSTIAGMASGAGSATLGLPSDIGALFVGIKDAVSAEDGEKIDTFTKSFTEFSKQNYGSEFFKEKFDSFVDSLNISDQYKEDAKSGYSAGEFGGVGGTVTAGAKAGVKTVKNLPETLENIGTNAQNRLDANTGTTTLSSMGGGEIDNMIDKGLSKLAPKLKTEGGINFSEDITSNNLRLHLARIDKSNTDNVPYPGGPKNPRTVIKSPNDKLPDIVVGDITFDDWKNRVEKTMDKEAILKASRWYDEVFEEFDKLSGGEPKEMRKLGEAWLSAQQNETPSSALSNVLSIYEQFKRGVPIDQVKGKGLPSANKIATDIIYGKQVSGGAGQKISDFIDSGYGKDVRSIMGNDPKGMSPFVVDVHTGRDTGLVDQEFINHLNRLGYDVPDNLIKDHAGGGIKGTMYENRAKFGQELTDHLNSINWLDKSDWKPREVQAIGWMNLTEMTGQLGTSGDVAGAFNRNLRRISMEVDPGEGSPWATKFGQDYGNLDDASKFDINNKVTAKAIELVNTKEGLNLSSNVHGTGGWELYQNPSTVSQTFASRDTAIKAGARLGYLLNQTEVWVNSAKEITKGAKHFGVDIVEEGSENLRNSDSLKDLFEKIIEKDPNGLFRGYQPIIVNGKPGIRIIIDDVAIKSSPLTKAKAQEYIQKFAGTDGELNNILSSLNFNVRTDITEVELTKLRNDWKENPNGEGYKEYFGNQAGTTEPGGSGSNLDNDGQELENLFGELIRKAKGNTGTTEGVTSSSPIGGDT